MASNELATVWCATPADDHIHEQNRDSIITQPTDQRQQTTPNR